MDFEIHLAETGYGVKIVDKNRVSLDSCSVRTGERQLPVSCFLCSQPTFSVLFNVFTQVSHILSGAVIQWRTC